MKALYSTLLYSTLPLAQNTDDLWCSEQQKKTCNDKIGPNIKLCFVDESDYDDPKSLRKNTTEVECPSTQYNVHRVQNQDAITKVLSDYAAKCNKIDEIIINGHATRLFSTVGNISAANIPSTFKVGKHKNAKCIMAPTYSKIRVVGCDAGQSCTGRINMYLLAKQLIRSDWGGSVIAPSSKHLPNRKEIPNAREKNHAEGGFHTQLDYHPKDKMEKWSAQGIIDYDDDQESISLSQVCLKVCTNILSMYDAAVTTKCNQAGRFRLEILKGYKDIRDNFMDCSLAAKNITKSKDFFMNLKKIRDKKKLPYEISELADQIYWAEDNMKHLKCIKEKKNKTSKPQATGK
jgi:hypothetical protein